MRSDTTPDTLRRAEFILVRFHLEFQTSFHLTRERALRLRRDLRQAAKVAFEGRTASERFEALFEPPLSADPVALKRHQRPGPAFVIFPPTPVFLAEGDVLELEAAFWGKGIHLLDDFARVLQNLGALGWHRGEGPFDLIALGSGDGAGRFATLWQRGRELGSLQPQLLDAAWWLETSHPADFPLELSFLTPARLLASERPLFRPCFARIFPFLLRRVTSVLHTWCGIEGLDDPTALLKAASRVREYDSTLAWTDWRTLEGGGERHDLGGVTGSVVLQGEGLEEILWVLALATLMNAGKGASFGAGHLYLRGIGPQLPF